MGEFEANVYMQDESFDNFISKLKENGIIESLVQVKTSMPEFSIVKEEFLEWFEQYVPLVVNVRNQLYIRLNHESDEKN